MRHVLTHVNAITAARLHLAPLDDQAYEQFRAIAIICKYVFAAQAAIMGFCLGSACLFLLVNQPVSQDVVLLFVLAAKSTVVPLVVLLGNAYVARHLRAAAAR